ncbi:MAG: ATP-dependent helicase [Clostridiales bacterium]|jgi:DNA helicase-2/ATP-dependent DNA helicase PcrA|nr:ATP-dependent helicase [Clostridiales bacterium]
MNFTPIQQEIINFRNGALLIQGVHGSGKSSVVAERVNRVMKPSAFSRIILLAPSYLPLIKIHTILSNNHYISSELLNKKVIFTTFYTYFLEILLHHSYQVGLGINIRVIDSVKDKMSILSDVVCHDPIYKTISQNENDLLNFLSKYLNLISNHKQQFIPPELSVESDPFPRIYRKYNESLRLRNTIDNDDVLFYANRLIIEDNGFSTNSATFSQYYVLDAHKINESHYRLFQSLIGAVTNEVSLIMVGDLNPLIGAPSLNYMQNFVIDFKPKIFNLKETYRTSNKIVAFVNHLTKLNVSLPCHHEGELEINFFNNELEEAKFVCSAIDRLLHANQHSIARNEIAIFARNKYSFPIIISELSRFDIPFSYLKSDKNISTEADVFKVLYSVLKLINNPKEIFHKNLLCKLLERTDLTINEAQNNLVEQILENTKFDWMINIIGCLSRENTLDFLDVLNSLKHNLPYQSSSYYNYLFENDLREWTEQWKRCRIYKKKWLIYSFFCAESQKINWPSSIKLLTPNMICNYAFDAVFIIDLAEGIFPDYRAILNGENAIAQEKAFFQSAVNKSKRLCYLSCSKSKQMPWGEIIDQEPSRFIADYNASDEPSDAPGDS